MGIYTAHTRSNLGSRGGALIPDYWGDFFRDALKPFYYLRQFGTLKTIPAFSGDRIRIPQLYTPYKLSNGVMVINGHLTAISAMSENTTISPKNVISANELTCTPVWYDGSSAYNRRAMLVTPLDEVQKIMDSLGGEAAARMEKAYYSAVSGTNIKVNGFTEGTKAGTAQAMKAKNFAQALAIMLTNGVPRWDDGNYVAYCHPLIYADIVNDVSANGFVALTQYGDPTRAYNGEVGMLHGFRIVGSNTVPRYAGGSTSATSYISGGVTGTHIMCFSPGSFYIAEMEGEVGLEFTHAPPTAQLADPNAKIGIVGIRYATGVVKAPATEKRILTIACATTIKP